MIIHTIQNGDSLYTLSRRYGVPVTKIAEDNDLKNLDKLTVGQTLVILVPEKSYTVKGGDTLEAIARRFNTSVMALMRNNPVLMGENTIYPGQVLAISYPTPKYGNITVNGFAFPNISREVLKRTLPYLTYLSIFSHSVQSDGTLREPNDAELISLAKDYGVLPTMVVTNLSQNGGFSEDLVGSILSNEQTKEKLINEIYSTVKEKGYNGVDLDFEYIGKSYANEYTDFIKKLRQKLCPEGYYVFVDLPPKTSEEQAGILYEGQNYSDIGNAANSVMLMTYEWGYTFSPPMPVAPIDRVREVALFASKEISPDKITLGIPNYGYEWTLPFVEGESRARSISNIGAVELAMQKNAKIEYDAIAQTPYFIFYEKENGNAIEHIVYFEDANSIKAKLDLVYELGFKGVGIWNIMKYFPQLWLVINSMFNIVKGYNITGNCN
ncbi:MAG: LysM peptidoglycan-binding domain-containing protein [Ruminococcaceae bacterium]|nr:LysM peptidoglycan-binding domain-containing protein [Oscillospiraceae bacterium]